MKVRKPKTISEKCQHKITITLLLIRTLFSTTLDVNSMTNERIESLPASVLDLDIGRHNDMLNLYNSIFGHSDADKTQLPCEFCGDLFPVDTLIMHQVRMQSSHKTVHQYCMSTFNSFHFFSFNIGFLGRICLLAIWTPAQQIHLEYL